MVLFCLSRSDSQVKCAYSQIQFTQAYACTGLPWSVTSPSGSTMSFASGGVFGTCLFFLGTRLCIWPSYMCIPSASTNSPWKHNNTSTLVIQTFMFIRVGGDGGWIHPVFLLFLFFFFWLKCIRYSSIRPKSREKKFSVHHPSSLSNVRGYRWDLI